MTGELGPTSTTNRLTRRGDVMVPCADGQQMVVSWPALASAARRLGRVIANGTQQSRPVDTDRIEMATAWASLSPNERRVLAHSALGAGLDDLAKLLGCGRGAAAMRLHEPGSGWGTISVSA